MNLIKQIIKHYLVFISITFVGRASLFFFYYERFGYDVQDAYMTFIHGLRMDLIAVSIVMIIPVVVLTLVPKFLGLYANRFLQYYFMFFTAIFLYVEIATFPFMEQYDSRPNFLFVEYLEYPKEVFSMLLSDYKATFAITIISIILLGYLYAKSKLSKFGHCFQIDYLKRAALFIPLALIVFIGIRSSFGHRPANNSDAMFSSSRVLNEITKNSVYSIGYAIYSNKKHSTKDIAKRYGEMGVDEAISRVQKRLNIIKYDEKTFLQHMDESHFKSANTKNIVIFIEESMGYQFVKAVGGEEGITPNFNKLSKEAVLFKNLYSNGTRSIRGLAGLCAGNCSVPGKGVLKRNKSQDHFFTIASMLKQLGYHSSFIYGGESRFDNMKSWFLGNGFDEIIDQDKIESPEYVGTWGVSDEDLVKAAHKKYVDHSKKNEKFVSVIFSTSNHTPFDFPKNKIELLDGVEEKSVKNAIKYADYAIGRFIEMAKKEQYYKDTIFVIAADHNVRVYGDDIIPVDMFHIPGMILGSDIKPYEYNKVATQPDVLATALDLAGIELSMPVMGHSIFSDKKQNIALMQFNDTYGLMHDNRVAVIRPNTKPLTFEYKNKRLSQIEHDEELEKDLLAFIVSLNYIYQHRLYK